MRQETRDFRAILEDALKGITEALESMDEKDLVLEEGEVRLDIKGGRGGYIIIRLPSGDTVAETIDKLTAEGRLTLPIIEFLLSRTLREYRIVAGEKVLDSKTVGKNEKVKVFIKRVPPLLLYWTVMQILRYVPLPPNLPPTALGEEVTTPPSEEVVPIEIE